MIPSGDHISRSIVHRRVASWASWSEGGTGTPQPTEPGEESMSVSASLPRSLLPELEYESEEDDLLSLISESFRTTNWKLWLGFIMLIVSGVSNVVLSKLQALPM